MLPPLMPIARRDMLTGCDKDSARRGHDGRNRS
jgi:hypothetical protein